jgi:hypothetical protein
VPYRSRRPFGTCGADPPVRVHPAASPLRVADGATLANSRANVQYSSRKCSQ